MENKTGRKMSMMLLSTIQYKSSSIEELIIISLRIFYISESNRKEKKRLNNISCVCMTRLYTYKVNVHKFSEFFHKEILLTVPITMGFLF